MKIRSLPRLLRCYLALLWCCVGFSSAAAFAADAGSTPKAIVPVTGEKWAATWATGMGGTFPGSAALNFAIPNPTTDGANEQTFRMLIKPDLWGRSMRFKFSNVFGTQPVTFGRATVGLQTYGANVFKGSLVQISFNGGSATATLPIGREIFSDPVTLPFVSGPDDPNVQGRNLAISYYVQGKSGPITYHSAAYQTSFLSGSGTGDRTQEENDASYPYSALSWFFIAGADVVAPADTRVLVGTGSSSADGTYSTIDGHDRFIDNMSRRLHAAYGNHVSVVNTGIGGDVAALPAPGGLQFIAQYFQQRLDRDVIGISGVTDSVIYLGVNDYTIALQEAPATIQAYRDIVQRLHAANIKVIMATITSTVGQAGRGGSDAGLANYAEVNRFIRNSGGLFDSVADFHAATADPSKGSIDADTAPLFPQFAAHSSFNPAPDFLHQGRAGMQAEASTLDLSFFAGPGY